MNTKLIFNEQIDENLTSKVEALQYEVNARKDIITFMLDKGMDIESPAFKKYHKELVEFTAQYEMIKSEIENIYLKDLMEPNKKYNWNLDFLSNTLTCEESLV